MKQIVITDEDAKQLVKDLEFEKLIKNHGLSSESKAINETVHRWFRYHVVSWLQKHGADLS